MRNRNYVIKERHEICLYRVISVRFKIGSGEIALLVVVDCP